MCQLSAVCCGSLSLPDRTPKAATALAFWPPSHRFFPLSLFSRLSPTALCAVSSPLSRVPNCAQLCHPPAERMSVPPRAQKSLLFLFQLALLATVHCQRYYDDSSIYSRPLPSNSRYGSSSSSSSSSCFDRLNRPIRCTPEFVNAAYHAVVDATNTCGKNGPSQYCVQTGAAGSNKKTCEVCDANSESQRHPPEFLVDFNDHHEHTWWQSESLFEGKWPKQVNLTLHLGKTFEITYVRLRFHSPRAESFAIYKKTTEKSEWEPFQFYSSNCLKSYNVSDRFYLSPQDETQALCTKEFSDISPLTGGNVVFTTLEGRPNATNFEHNDRLQVSLWKAVNCRPLTCSTITITSFSPTGICHCH